MTSWVAFLRGINVGGHRKLPMAELRKICADVFGARDVRSYIASGNVVLRCDLSAVQIASALRTAIAERYGYDVPIMVRSGVQMQDLLASCPFVDGKGNQVFAYLCDAAPAPDWAKIDDLKTETERVEQIENTVWLHAPDGVGRSKLAAQLERLIGGTVTARNLNTVVKMVEMVSATD